MGREVLFSIIVPIYNTEEYLDECLQSVFAQTYKNFEIICIDDASTDNSIDIIRKYANNDNLVIMQNDKNMGLGASRNNGIRVARGEYLVFLDSDDTIEKNALDKLKSCIQEEPDIVAFNCDVRLLSGDVKKYEGDKKYYSRKFLYPVNNVGKNLFVKMINSNDFIYSAWLICPRKRFLDDNNIRFPENMLHEDVLYSISSYVNASKAIYLQDKLYTYRIRNDSITTSQTNYQSRYDAIVHIIAELSKKLFIEDDDNIVDSYARIIKNYVPYLKSLRHTFNEKRSYANRKEEFVSQLLTNWDNEQRPYANEYDVFENSNGEMSAMGLLCMISKYESVFIYGAGIIGCRVFEYLKKNAKLDNFRGFLVSDSSNYDELLLNGNPIYPVDYCKEKNEDYIVIIAGNKRNSVDMCKMLNKIGVSNYIIIDEQLNKYLREMEQL